MSADLIKSIRNILWFGTHLNHQYNAQHHLYNIVDD